MMKLYVTCGSVHNGFFSHVCVSSPPSEKLQTFSQNLSKKALDLYPDSEACPTTDRCPERSYTTMVSDIRVTCPNNDLARRAAGEPPPRPRLSAEALSAFVFVSVLSCCNRTVLHVGFLPVGSLTRSLVKLSVN